MHKVFYKPTTLSAGQHHLTFSHFFYKKTACHREALFAEAIFLQTRDCFAEKRSQ
jgi:hypothetical protein